MTNLKSPFQVKRSKGEPEAGSARTAGTIAEAVACRESPPALHRAACINSY